VLASTIHLLERQTGACSYSKLVTAAQERVEEEGVEEAAEVGERASNLICTRTTRGATSTTMATRSSPLTRTTSAATRTPTTSLVSI